MDMRIFDKAAACFPDECFAKVPDVGLLLGSGWGNAIPSSREILRISYNDIVGLGSATVQGHAGEFVLYEQAGKRVAAWCGRRHFYEGTGWESVVMPIEILRRMGCDKVLLTNASGGINHALKPGDFVIIRDHLNPGGLNPLIGEHRPEWGERFPDMTQVYNKHLSELLHASAKKASCSVMDGIYAFSSGPCYETPAGIQAYKFQGADIVGMSTVPEAIFAKACGFKVAGLSLVSNLAAGISRSPLNHEEVVAAGVAAKPRMKAVVEDFIAKL
jgi:purine-nucleoside phosphorylase